VNATERADELDTSPEPTPGDRASADAIETLIIPRAVGDGEMVVRRFR
jgi:hypothetical protein